MGNGRLLSRRTAGFPKVRTGRPDHDRTSHFDNQVGFSEEFLLKNQSFAHTIQNLTDLAEEFSLHIRFSSRPEWFGLSVLTNRICALSVCIVNAFPSIKSFFWPSVFSATQFCIADCYNVITYKKTSIFGHRNEINDKKPYKPYNRRGEAVTNCETGCSPQFVSN